MAARTCAVRIRLFRSDKRSWYPFELEMRSALWLFLSYHVDERKPIPLRGGDQRFQRAASLVSPCRLRGRSIPGSARLRGRKPGFGCLDDPLAAQVDAPTVSKLIDSRRN